MDMLDIISIVRNGAARNPDAPAVIFEDTVQTYGQLYDRSCRLANILGSLGVKPGERVATLNENCLESVELIAGVALGGYVRSALYTYNSADSNLYLLNLVGASALIMHADMYPALADRLGEVDGLRHIIVFGGPTPEGAIRYESALAAASAEDPAIEVSDDDPHLIRFSSGTTGKSKGILHTVGRWRAVATEMALCLPPLSESDKYLAAGPLAHAAMLPMYGTLAAGGAVVVMPTFHPATFIADVEKYRCTTTQLVPTMIQIIASMPEARTADLSSLRAVFYGAAPISERTLAEGRAIWGDIMYQLYGQSEAVPLTVLAPDEHVGNRLRSVGRATPNTVIRIVDETGVDVPTGEVGEIAVRTPAAMAGIWGDEAATRDRLLDDGSLLTADMGYLDEDGFLFLADRKQDMIISGGFNIWPAELENALASHPAVAEVAVVGVPHEKWGETPKAVVVLRKDLTACEQELIDWTRDKVGAIKRVTSVDFANSLPKSPVGKVLRREVKKQFWDDASHTIAGA